MGYSLAWVGLENALAAELYAERAVVESGARGHFYAFPIAGLALPNKWYVLTAKGCDHSIGSSRVLSSLSAKRTIVACVAEEHMMYSSCALWREGQQVWAVRHRGGDFGIMDLVTEGSLP
jgi:hypothetical protein